MKPTFIKIIFAAMLLFSMLAGATLDASAARAVPKYPTVITFSKLTSVDLGDSFTLSGYVKNSFGVPVPKKALTFMINGKKLGGARTDATGFFERKFKKPLDAGKYTIIAFTKATHYLLASSASTHLEILPAVVHIQTIPAIPDIPFALAGQQVSTGQDGTADIKIGKVGDYPLTILTNQYNNPDQQIQFARWIDDTNTPYKVIKIPTKKVIQVGFNVFEKVGQSFVDLGGFPVSPNRVAEFTIRSAQGDLFTFSDGQPRWLPASRVVRFQNGLVPTNLLYSVISMTVDGANVVNKSQQRFYTSPNGNWQISLILYSLTIRANDGLFGSSVGKSVNLVYPDGHAQNYPLDHNGTVAIHSLARGNYTVEVLDTKGLKQIIPVALSRSQTVDIKVPTRLDLLLLASAGIFSALTLVFFGRRRILFSRMRSFRPAYQIAHSTQVNPNEVHSPEKITHSPQNSYIKWS